MSAKITKIMKKLFTTALLLLIAVSVYALVLAEEQAPAAQTKPPTAPTAQEDQAEAETRLEEFVPSEEVSIDKPVAFPVDI